MGRSSTFKLVVRVVVAASVGHVNVRTDVEVAGRHVVVEIEADG